MAKQETSQARQEWRIMSHTQHWMALVRGKDVMQETNLPYSSVERELKRGPFVEAGMEKGVGRPAMTWAREDSFHQLGDNRGEMMETP